MSEESINPEFERTARDRLARHGLEGTAVRWLERVDSTMNAARAALEREPSHSFLLIAADTQSGGRGRQGRVWQSDPGGLYLTIARRSGLGADRLGGWSLVVGCALRRVCSSLGLPCEVKWPNDLMAEGRKLAGILIETAGSENIVVYTGIGMNVTNRLFDPTAAARLGDLISSPPALPELAAETGAEVERCWRLFAERGLEPFREEWLAAAMHHRKRVTVDLGNSIVSGEFEGIGPLGELLLREGGSVRSVAAGHLISG